MIRALLAILALTAIYAVVLTSFDPGDLLAGALLATGLVAAFYGFLFGSKNRSSLPLVSRMVAFFPFAWLVLLDVIRGTWQVALVVSHLRPLRSPGFVEVPVGERSKAGAVVTALVTMLSPGSVLVDMKWEDKLLIFHYLDASNPDEIRARQDQFYNNYQRKVFP